MSVHVCVLKVCEHSVLKTADGNFIILLHLGQVGDNMKLLYFEFRKSEVKVVKADAYASMALCLA